MELVILKLESFDGSSWVERWSVTGQQQNGSGDAWLNVSLDLSSILSINGRFCNFQY